MRAGADRGGEAASSARLELALLDPQVARNVCRFRPSCLRPGPSTSATAPRDLQGSLVEVFLERHAIVAKPRTITELRWRLKQSEEKFGDIPLAELEGMTDEIGRASCRERVSDTV